MGSRKIKLLMRKTATLFIIACLLMPQIPAASAREGGTTLAAPFGGTLEEWEGIDSDFTVSENELTYLKAVQKPGFLFFCVRGKAIRDNFEFFIDADIDATTGMDLSEVWRNGAGIDYKVSGEKVYRYENGNWTEAGSATVVKSETVLEAGISLNQLGIDGTNKIKVAFAMEGNNYLPEPARDMLAVEGAPKTQFAPEVIPDGDDAEWQSLEPLAAGMDAAPYDTVRDLYAFRTGSELYLMVHVTTYDAVGIKTNIYIDTDNNPETGYQNWGQFANAGGDILVQSGNLYRSGGSGWEWTEICTGSAVYVLSSEPDENGLYTMEIKVDLSDAGQLSETLRLAFELENAGYAPPIWRGDSYVAVPNLSPQISIVADGDDSDWGEIEPAAEGQGSVRDLYAIRKGHKLYVLLHSKEQNYDFMHIFINTDNNPETGWQNWGQYANAGADFLVEGTALFRNIGAGWAWDFVSDVTVSISAEPDPDGFYTVEAEIDLDVMGEISETLKLSVEINENGYAPLIWSNLDYAAVISATDSNPVAIDGDDSEWGRIDTVSRSSGENTVLHAVMDYTRLFTLIKGDNLNVINTYYIDADNNPETGYRSEYWQDSGIDFKVDKGVLYKFTGTLQNPGWKKTGMVYFNAYPGHTEMYLNLKQIGLEKPQEIKLGYTGKNSIVLPQKGSNMLSVSKTVFWDTQDNTYYPAEIYDVLNNPYIGWVPWAKDKDFDYHEEYPQPHSLVYAGFTWREIEPEKGIYKWDELEEKYQLDFWAKQGKKINFRFIMDMPSDTLHMDIPDWLYEELNTHPDGAGQFYDTSEIGKGFTPNYSNPLLIEYHRKFIEEFAKRYDNDPRVAYIQLGSLGHWAEWHNWPEDKTGKFPKLDVSDQYVQHYLDNFKNKLIGMRKPFPVASENKLGLFNDMFGEKGSTDSWLEWTRTGWNEIYLYVNEGQDPQDVKAASAMPEFWKYSFSGGEFYNGNASLSLTDDRIMESLRQVRESHTSWLGPCSPAIYEEGCEFQHNIDILHKTMGYRYVIESVTHAPKVNPGEELQISMVWNNKGVAPMYYDWPVELSLADPSGNIAASFILDDISLKEILPGRTAIHSAVNIPESLSHGTYTLCIAILDPYTNEPGIQLAIEGKREDGRYVLDSVHVGSGAVSGNGPGSSAPALSPINVNGRTVYAGEISTGETPDGRKTRTIIVRPSVINAFQDIENPTITLNLSGSEAVKTCIFSGMTVSKMDDLKATIEFNTDAASCLIPAEELRVVDLAGEFGQNADLSDIKVSITIAEANDSEVQKFTKAAMKYNADLIVKPVSFLIYGEFNGEEVDVSRFEKYITGLIRIPSGIDPASITTAVVLGEDGTLRHVPTRLIAIDGEYFAEIRFLSDSLYSLIRKSAEFKDCKDHYAREAVDYLASRLIVRGVGNDNYSPDRDVTRGEFAVMISRALGLPDDETVSCFYDVNETDWYCPGVSSAAGYGIIFGYGDGSFGPGDRITREQAMAVIARAMKVAGHEFVPEPGEIETILGEYSDADEISTYFRKDAAACIKAQIVAGKTNSLIAPKDYLTRAEAAVMVRKLLQKSGLTD